MPNLQETFEYLKELSKKQTEKSKKPDINMIILTDRVKEETDNKLFRTAKRIEDVCKKHKIPCYPLFISDGYVKKDDDNSLTVHNIDDEKGFPIDPDQTIAFIRGSAGAFQSSLNLISQLERAGIFTINSRETLEICSDKYRTTLKLADAALPTPITSLLRSMDGLEHALDIVERKFPLILKTISGSKGIGVLFVESEKSLVSILQTIWKINEEQEMILQQYIPIKYDVRVHVLGSKDSKVIASMKRHVMENDFRSNYSLGSKVEPIKLSKETEDLCVLAHKAVGGVWTGVDLVFGSKKEPYIIEVNSSAGTEGIEKATNKGIVDEVFEYVINRENWTKVAIECGVVEVFDIDQLGEMKAKMDTGNSGINVIHAEDWKIDGSTVKWTHNGSKVKSKLIRVEDVKVGGRRDYTEERPVIELDVTFNGVIYKDVEFSLSDRSKRNPILVERSFLKKMNVMINPCKRYVLSKKIEKGE